MGSISPPLINLLVGWPTPRLFPADELATATKATLSDPEIVKKALIYGPDLGYQPLRASIASWLSEFYQPSSGPVPTDRIGVSGGASTNLASILQIFSDPVSTSIWMVEPVYFHACTIFQDAGFSGKLLGVREGDEGIDLDFFRRALLQSQYEPMGSVKAQFKPPGQYEKIYRHILYTTPTFSNPSGKTMSPGKRRELVSLAREFDVLIISDDVYDFLRWPIDGKADQPLTAPPQRIVDIDRETCLPGSWGNAISNASFSKIVAPGVRVGWYEATEKFVARLSVSGSTRSGGNPGHMSSAFIHHVLSTKALQRHIDSVLIPTYRARCQSMLGAIERYLVPLGVNVTAGVPYTQPSTSEVLPAGGFFTYITFPNSLPTADVIAARALDEFGLKIAAGKIFLVKGDSGSLQRSAEEGGFCHGARLCWAWEEAEAIEEGIQRLARVVQAFWDDSKEI